MLHKHLLSIRWTLGILAEHSLDLGITSGSSNDYKFVHLALPMLVFLNALQYVASTCLLLIKRLLTRAYSVAKLQASFWKVFALVRM